MFPGTPVVVLSGTLTDRHLEATSRALLLTKQPGPDAPSIDTTFRIIRSGELVSSHTQISVITATPDRSAMDIMQCTVGAFAQACKKAGRKAGGIVQ
jgi:hypothetical protein